MSVAMLREHVRATAAEWDGRHMLWAAALGWLAMFDMGGLLIWGHDLPQVMRAWLYNALQFGVPYVFLVRLSERAIAAGLVTPRVFLGVTLLVPPLGTWVGGPLLHPLFGGGEGWTRIDDLDLCASRLLTFAFASLLYLRWREQQALLAELGRAALERERVQQEVQTARLLALQARVDPEFLFATLGRVRRRIKEPGPAAEHLLGHLIALLRALQPGADLRASTLGRELQLLRAFGRAAEIEALQAGRIDYEVAPRLDGARLAPLVLLPLLRGLAAAVPSQRWALAAQERDGRLVLALRARVPVGAGTAAALGAAEFGALRERLVVTHGASARLDLVGAPDLGLRIDVPLQLAAAPAAGEDPREEDEDQDPRPDR